MIPYFPGHLLDLPRWLPGIGGYPIHWFGVLVALGVIIGDRIVVMRGGGAASTKTTSST